MNFRSEQSRYLYILFIISSLHIDVLCQSELGGELDTGCVSPDTLLEGRTSIQVAELRASNDISGNRASQAKFNDNGWCSSQLGTDIFDPYLEVDFGIDLLFTSVETQGLAGGLFGSDRFIERYRLQVAGEDSDLQYITPSINSSQPAIFPLGQSGISDTDTHRESLPRPVMGQRLRINPYEWNDEDHVCTRLEVYGCPLQECQQEIELNNNRYVDNVTVDGSAINDYDGLFDFNADNSYYCGPTESGPFTMTIFYSSQVFLTEIGISGYDEPWTPFNDYVTSFSLSFSEDDSNFTEYMYARHTQTMVFTVSNYEKHYFALWPPITASSIRITINDWNDRPCMSLFMLGCNYSDVVDHSIDVTNRTANGTDSGLVNDMTVTLTTTETVTQTTTENVTVTADLYCTPSPSPSQSSSTAGSTSCSSSDTDNTPIYVAVAIVITGLLITITIIIIGVILYHHYQKEKECDRSNGLVTINDKTANGTDTAGMSVVEVENDLYGKELRPQSQSGSGFASPGSNDQEQSLLYDEADAVKKQPGVTETIDNPQYADTTKQSDAKADSETFYSYAIP